ncbi:hypothetical protein HanRHA438_Chr02g0085081 [Helianthus annuus]|nr:hypothetical protein HanIR_Chr02g0086331 [Helianthus annuus]KAJ0940585.1 hypothetical protein HanRHA438_Chr02g0085081 [Helianthus annuus]KAJ0952355.1 hypothetical protein HanPSC8_Chr02g0071291 [Helianthus annuus]
MVLWEITLATAYFLGLKRTYRHALRIQRRLVSPNYPTVRQFLHSKTRTVFDVTLKVHREVQKRDIEVGRNLGNWILQWLDRMKPAAQIQAGGPIQYTSNTMRIPSKRLSDYRRRITAPAGVWYQESRKRLATSSRNLLLTAYPTVSRLLRRQVPVTSNMQYRQLVSSGNGFAKGVIRDDIMQWLSRG